MHGQTERAEAALNELGSASGLVPSHVSAAELSRAQGELAWARGDLARAESCLRQSIAQWLQVSASLCVAEVRLRLCELLRRAGDLSAAELELGAAQAAFEIAAAEPMLERCRELRQSLARSG